MYLLLYFLSLQLQSKIFQILSHLHYISDQELEIVYFEVK